MQRVLITCAVAFVVLGLSGSLAVADPINITVNDSQQKGTDPETIPSTAMSWYGIGQGDEDQEVEFRDGVNASLDQLYDLEAATLDGFDLGVVGQWDFFGSVGAYESGDIWIDVKDSGQTWDYVFDIARVKTGGVEGAEAQWDSSNKTYVLYALGAGWSQEPGAIHFPDSDPYKLTALGQSTQVATGSYSVIEDSSFWTGFEGTSKQYWATGFDLSPIGYGFEFNAHFTMQCGNDEVEGMATAPVPEPASIALIGLGSLGFAAARRRRRQPA